MLLPKTQESHTGAETQSRELHGGVGIHFAYVSSARILRVPLCRALCTWYARLHQVQQEFKVRPFELVVLCDPLLRAWVVQMLSGVRGLPSRCEWQ